MGQSNAYSDLRVFGEIKSGKLTIFGEYSLPTTDGLANQILVTDGAGNVSFQDASSVALTPPSIIDGTGLNWTTVAPNTIQGNVSLAPFTTTDLAEGTNLYYQDEYVDDRVNALLINGTGITKAYNDALNTLTIGVTLAPFSTTDLAEGTNLYYTDERVEDRMAAVLYKGIRGTGPDAISWTHVDGLDRIYPTVSLTPFSTDDLAEGTTNLYLTENALYDLMDQIIQDSASVTWTRDNLTNQLTASSATAMIEIQHDGVSIATNPTIDFITTPEISYTINDDIINNKTTVQINFTGGEAVIIEGFGTGSSVRKDNLNNSIGSYSTVSGGSGNTASGDYSAIAGGTCNSITSVGSFVGGGTNHNVSGDGISAGISIVSTGPFPNAVDGSYFPTTTSSGFGTGTKLGVQIVSNFVFSWQLLAIGVNYQVGDTITIDGADVGGISGVDDIVFTVDTVIDGGSVVAGGFNNDSFGAMSSIGGGINNLVCAHSSVIAGGSSNCINGIFGFSDFGVASAIGGGDANSVFGYSHVIAGGIENVVSATNSSTIGGGDTNSIVIPFDLNNQGFSTIAGGNQNSILTSYGSIGGGKNNLVCGEYGAVAGGYQNSASGCYTAIAGGTGNSVNGANGAVVNFSSSIISPITDGTYIGYPTGGSGSGALIILDIRLGVVNYALVLDGGSGYEGGDVLTWIIGSPGEIQFTVGLTSSGSSSILGGSQNSICGVGSAIVGGQYNCINGPSFATISGGFGNTVGIQAPYSNIAGGLCNTLSGYFIPFSTISGGYSNTVSLANSVIGGGVENSITCFNSVIGGGYQNLVASQHSVISGGSGNTISSCARNSTIGGGYQNEANSCDSTVGGGELNCVSGNASTISGGYCNIVLGSYSNINGGCNNSTCGSGAVVSGGCRNSSNSFGNLSFIGSGQCNSITRCYSSIVGGEKNTIPSAHSFIGGGCFNKAGQGAETTYLTIGGGRCNYAHGTCNFIGGGYCNEAYGYSSSIVGGLCNTASADYSSILGGSGNSVSHCHASAVGCNITSVCPNTLHTNYLNLYTTPANDQCNTSFLVRSSNGMVNYRTYGGLFAQTANGTTVTATNVETSALGTGVGSLSVPANGFQVGDSFVLHLTGTVSAANNETLTIKLKSGSTVLASSGAITLPVLTSKKWNLDAHFTIRATGAAGVAALMTSGAFTYNQNTGNTVDGVDFESLNNTTFDTTASNTLSVTVQWGSNNATNSISTSLGILEKIF